jgi:F-type H+-transporting ATPase subunit delta
MNESIIAVRYTKAIFSLAKEKNILDHVKSDIEIIYSVLNESPELRQFFENPVLMPSKKKEVIDHIFKSLHPQTLSFINLLIDNKREEYMHQIARNFLDKYRQYKGIQTVVFTSVVKIEEKTVTAIIELVKNIFKTDVELTSQLNEKIIGGFILRIGDKQFNASIHSSLNKIKRKLLNTTVN